MTSSSASSVRSMQSPPTLVLASVLLAALEPLFAVGAATPVDGALASFLAASCARKEDAEAVAALAEEEATDEAGALPLPPAPPVSPVLERFVNAEFLNMFGGEERVEEAELPLLPPLCARSRSTSDELVAAALGATVDADRPSPGK